VETTDKNVHHQKMTEKFTPTRTALFFFINHILFQPHDVVLTGARNGRCTLSLRSRALIYYLFGGHFGQNIPDSIHVCSFSSVFIIFCPAEYSA